MSLVSLMVSKLTICKKKQQNEMGKLLADLSHFRSCILQLIFATR